MKAAASIEGIKNLVDEQKTRIHKSNNRLDILRVTGNHAVHPGTDRFQRQRAMFKSLFQVDQSHRRRPDHPPHAP